MDVLTSWKADHAITCKFVHCINSCFGSIILIAVAHNFVSFIRHSYQLIASLHLSSDMDGQVRHLLILFLETIYASVLICTSYILQAEVTNVKLK